MDEPSAPDDHEDSKAEKTPEGAHAPVAKAGDRHNLDKKDPAKDGATSRGQNEPPAARIGVAGWMVAVATGVIAIANIFYTIYARGQLRVITNQLEEMRSSSADTKSIAQAAGEQARVAAIQAKAAEAAAEAAKKTAAATEKVALNAEKTIQTMRENLRTDQRPWVGPSNVVISGDFRMGNKPSVVVTYLNTGKTPALEVNSRATAMARFKDAPFVANYPLEMGRRQITVVLPGQGMVSTTSPLEATPREFEDLKTGTRILYTWGEIRYDDAFGRHHRTTYCFFFNLELQSAPCHTYAYAD